MQFRIYSLWRVRWLQGDLYQVIFKELWRVVIRIKVRGTVWKFLKKLKIELPYDPAIQLLGICPEKTLI